MFITEQYRKEQELLHAKGGYGTASLQFGEAVSELVNKSGAESILDYGCGKMRNLAKVLELDRDTEYFAYDPAVPEFAQTPMPADVVVCIDVLEHIEPELLDNVLDDLKRCTIGHGFFTIHTGPAMKTLSDGRNAHLIQQPASWWLPKILDRWELRLFKPLPNGFMVIVR
jgi:hypothetical protein